MQEHNKHINESLIKVINTVDDAIYIKDLDGAYTYVNETAARLIGHSVDRLIGVKDADIFPAQALRQIIALDQKVLLQKRSISTETHYALDNKDIWFQTVLSPAYSSDDQIIGLIGISRDITEQKLAAQKLKTYAQELDVILSNSSDAIYRKDLHGRYVFINETGATMLDLTPEQVIGHTDSELFGEQVSKKIRKTDRQVLTTESPQSFTTKYSHNNDDHWFNVSVNPAYDNKNRIIGIVGISQNITETKRLELQLREKNEQLITILDSSRDAIFAKDVKGQYLFINKAGEDFIGLPAEEVVGKTDQDIFPASIYETVRMLDIEVMKTKKHITNDECYGDKNNKAWFQATISPAYSSSGEIIGVIGVSRNMTDYHLTQENLWKSESRYYSLYNDTPAIFITLDVDGAVIEANAYGAKKLGYSVEELKKCSIYNIIPTEDRNKFRNNLQTALDNPGTLYQSERRYIAKNGNIIWGKDFLRVVFDQDGNPSIPMLAEDITTTKELSEELHFRDTHDLITGLYNRRGIEQQIERALKDMINDTITHILFTLKVDNFRLINDSCGHKAADELLKSVAKLIVDNCRERDIIARTGVGEFAVLIENSSFPEVENNIEILLEIIGEYDFTFHQQLFHLSVSMGVFELDHNTVDADYAMSRAINAMFTAKELGKNKFHFYDKSDIGIKSRQDELETFSNTNLALSQNKFKLHVQPITPIQNNDNDPAIYYEVLVRMEKDHGEYAKPASFIPIMEHHNTIDQLDNWVVRNTLSWLNQNRDIIEKLGYVSINLSGQSLSNDKLLDNICNHFIKYDIPHQKICFEITETAAISALNQALVFITTLRNFGCRIALDDFGAGLSSFQYLRDLPVDFVKIDGAFIKNIHTNDSDFMLTRGLNDLIHQMGMYTVAEYVENEEILTLLQNIGVDFAQGYYYGKPQPIETITP